MWYLKKRESKGKTQEILLTEGAHIYIHIGSIVIALKSKKTEFSNLSIIFSILLYWVDTVGRDRQ